MINNKTKNMKKLLMLGTSKGSVQMLEYAKSKGYYTICTDPNTPEYSAGKKVSDEYWMIDTANIDELEDRCLEEGVDGVCCGISTFCTPSVMALGNRLNMPVYCTPESWHYTMDKYDFKQLCIKNHVPVATSYYVSNPPLQEEIDKIQLPVMVKAVDQSSNRGMSYCYNKSDILPAIKYAHSFSDNDKVVVERMLHGVEYTAYYAVADGESSLVCLYSDLAEPGTPGKCYAVNSTACDKLELYLEEVNPSFKNFLKDAGVKEGVCWIELMLDEDGHFYVIEMGYRMTGDMMAIPIRDACGFDSYKWLVDYAMGENRTKDNLPEDQSKMPEKCGCGYILWSKDMKGKVASITGDKEIQRMCGEYGMTLEYNIAEGESFMPQQYLITFVFTRNSAKEAIDVIKLINDRISILDENGNDIASRFTDFKTLERIYQKGLEK